MMGDSAAMQSAICSADIPLATPEVVCSDAPVELLAYVVTAVGAYVVGSVPTGYLVARARGVDIRSVGSGNIGATNAFRVLGTAAGTTVLAADALKGFLSCWLAGGLVTGWLDVPAGRELEVKELAAITGGLFAILGHNYTCWLKFRGGKGIATTAGVLLGLLPLSLAIVLGVWLVVLALTRYVSVASILAAITLPFSAWGLGRSHRLILVAGLMSALAIYKHRTNIQRLMAGTENRLGRKSPDAAVEKRP
jgi:glycerol-3-phosphate acyltransferase PlsY